MNFITTSWIILLLNGIFLGVPGAGDALSPAYDQRMQGAQVDLHFRQWQCDCPLHHIQFKNPGTAVQCDHVLAMLMAEATAFDGAEVCDTQLLRSFPGQQDSRTIKVQTLASLGEFWTQFGLETDFVRAQGRSLIFRVRASKNVDIQVNDLVVLKLKKRSESLSILDYEGRVHQWLDEHNHFFPALVRTGALNVEGCYVFQLPATELEGTLEESLAGQRTRSGNAYEIDLGDGQAALMAYVLLQPEDKQSRASAEDALVYADEMPYVGDGDQGLSFREAMMANARIVGQRRHYGLGQDLIPLQHNTKEPYLWMRDVWRVDPLRGGAGKMMSPLEFTLWGNVRAGGPMDMGDMAPFDVLAAKVKKGLKRRGSEKGDVTVSNEDFLWQINGLGEDVRSFYFIALRRYLSHWAEEGWGDEDSVRYLREMIEDLQVVIQTLFAYYLDPQGHSMDYVSELFDLYHVSEMVQGMVLEGLYVFTGQYAKDIQSSDKLFLSTYSFHNPQFMSVREFNEDESYSENVQGLPGGWARVVVLDDRQDATVYDLGISEKLFRCDKDQISDLFGLPVAAVYHCSREWGATLIVLEEEALAALGDVDDVMEQMSRRASLYRDSGAVNAPTMTQSFVSLAYRMGLRMALEQQGLGQHWNQSDWKLFEKIYRLEHDLFVLGKAGSFTVEFAERALLEGSSNPLLLNMWIKALLHLERIQAEQVGEDVGEHLALVMDVFLNKFAQDREKCSQALAQVIGEIVSVSGKRAFWKMFVRSWPMENVCDLFGLKKAPVAQEVADWSEEKCLQWLSLIYLEVISGAISFDQCVAYVAVLQHKWTFSLVERLLPLISFLLDQDLAGSLREEIEIILYTAFHNGRVESLKTNFNQVYYGFGGGALLTSDVWRKITPRLAEFVADELIEILKLFLDKKARLPHILAHLKDFRAYRDVFTVASLSRKHKAILGVILLDLIKKSTLEELHDLALFRGYMKDYVTFVHDWFPKPVQLLLLKAFAGHYRRLPGLLIELDIILLQQFLTADELEDLLEERSRVVANMNSEMWLWMWRYYVNREQAYTDQPIPALSEQLAIAFREQGFVGELIRCYGLFTKSTGGLFGLLADLSSLGINLDGRPWDIALRTARVTDFRLNHKHDLEMIAAIRSFHQFREKIAQWCLQQPVLSLTLDKLLYWLEMYPEDKPWIEQIYRHHRERNFEFDVEIDEKFVQLMARVFDVPRADEEMVQITITDPEQSELVEMAVPISFNDDLNAIFPNSTRKRLAFGSHIALRSERFKSLWKYRLTPNEVVTMSIREAERYLSAAEIVERVTAFYKGQGGGQSGYAKLYTGQNDPALLHLSEHSLSGISSALAALKHKWPHLNDQGVSIRWVHNLNSLGAYVSDLAQAPDFIALSPLMGDLTEGTILLNDSLREYPFVLELVLMKELLRHQATVLGTGYAESDLMLMTYVTFFKCNPDSLAALKGQLADMYAQGLLAARWVIPASFQVSLADYEIEEVDFQARLFAIIEQASALAGQAYFSSNSALIDLGSLRELPGFRALNGAVVAYNALADAA